MFTASERLIALEKILGPDPKTTNNKTHYTWKCIHCGDEDGKGDNFHFDYLLNKYNCFVSDEHTRAISLTIREFYRSNRKIKPKKEALDLLSILEAPQEIRDYLSDRLLTKEALHKLNVQYDKTYGLLYIPPALYGRAKLKDIFSNKVWWEEEFLVNKKFSKDDEQKFSKEYFVEKYCGQRNVIILEGIPDIWGAASFFPEEFLKDHYITAHVNGCTYIPPEWKEPAYWDKFENIYIIPHQDTNQAGQNAGKKIASFIKKKSNTILLPLKHKRMVYGTEFNFPSTDFNDWMIEGGTYEEFLKLLDTTTHYDKIVEKAAWDFLKSPDLLDLFLEDCKQFRIVKETNNKVQLFLEGCSRLTKEVAGGVSSRGIASSASGKSTLYKAIGKNFFGDDFITISDISEKAMFHLPQDAWKYKIIMFEEDYSTSTSPAIESKQCQLRLAKSEGKINYMYTDVSTKPMTVKEGSQEGPWSIWTTCTKMNIKDEDVNRDMVHHFDESVAQTIAINESQRHHGRFYDPLDEILEQFIKDKHKKIQEILKAHIPDKIVIHDKHKIKFPSFLIRARRDYPRLQRYIEILAFVFQFQRQVFSTKEYLCQFSKDLKGSVERKNGRRTEAEHFRSLPFSNMQYLQELELNSQEFEKNGNEGSPMHRDAYLSPLFNQRILVATALDIENALKYIGIDLEKEYIGIDSQVFERYQLLRTKFGVMESLPTKDAANELGISVRHFRSLMEIFADLDLVDAEKQSNRWKYTLKAYNKTQDDFGKFISFDKENNSVASGGVDKYKLPEMEDD
jgi:hypothetical protein